MVMLEWIFIFSVTIFHWKKSNNHTNGSILFNWMTKLDVQLKWPFSTQLLWSNPSSQQFVSLSVKESPLGGIVYFWWQKFPRTFQTKREKGKWQLTKKKNTHVGGIFGICWMTWLSELFWIFIILWLFWIPWIFRIFLIF